MKSYREFCALSRALDLVGDRWTMLVVRELLIAPSRYSDLQRSLPGIATNLLAQRLKSLEAEGIVSSTVQPPPVSARVHQLTEWGRGLEPALVGLARWGAPLLAPGLEGDHSQGHWLAFAVKALFPSPQERTGEPTFAGHPFPSTSFPTLTVAVTADGEHLLLEVDQAGIRTHVTGTAASAEVTIAGTGDEVFRSLSGEATELPRAAVVGSPDALDRFEVLTRCAYTSALDLAAFNRQRIAATVAG